MKSEATINSDLSYNEYIQEIKKIKLLTREEEYSLTVKASNGDIEARNSVIEANLLLVVKVALRYKKINKNISLMDLIEDGNLGLLRATEKFDPKRGFRFSTYAIWWIRQAIQKSVQQSMGNFSLPPNISDQIKQLKTAENELAITLERPPSADELATKLGKTVEELSWLVSINHALYKINDSEESETSIVDSLVSSGDSPPEALFKKQTSEEVDNLLKYLNDKELQIIKIRNGLGMDWDEIANFLQNCSSQRSITVEKVKKIAEEADKKLRQPDGTLNEIIYTPSKKDELMKVLDRFEILIVKIRNYFDVTLQEIAAVLKITRERVRQIENEAIRKLKQVISFPTNTKTLLQHSELIELFKKTNKIQKPKKDS